MNDDGVILNVLNAIVHAVLALPGGSDTLKASFPQFVNALGFCTIGLNPFLGIAEKTLNFQQVKLNFTRFFQEIGIFLGKSK